MATSRDHANAQSLRGALTAKVSFEKPPQPAFLTPSMSCQSLSKDVETGLAALVQIRSRSLHLAWLQVNGMGLFSCGAVRALLLHFAKSSRHGLLPNSAQLSVPLTATSSGPWTD